MTKSHKLFLKWLSQISLIIFFIFMAYDQGLITKILSSDKSFITSVILVLFYFSKYTLCIFYIFSFRGIKQGTHNKKSFTGKCEAKDNSKYFDFDF